MSPHIGWILQEEVVPRLRSAVPRAVKQVGAEDAEELVQDATVMAAQMMERNELRGKQVTPGNVAYYTIQHLKSGRRANGSSSVDVMATGTQLNGSARLDSLNMAVLECEAGEELLELHDIISTDHEDPSVKAGRKIDWDVFCQSLTKLELVLVVCLVNGLGVKEAAERAKVHYCTMQSYRKQIAVKLLEFMGADILKDIAHPPSWRINLDAERESVLCRHERRALA